MSTVGERGATAAAPVTLAVVSLWRLALAGCAWYGFVTSLYGDIANLAYFSQLSTLAVAVVASVALFSPLWNQGRTEGHAGFLRGAAVTYATVTMLVFNVVMEGGLDTVGSRFEHLIVPLIAIADWLVVGHNQGRVRAWVPLLWLAPVACYLPVYIARSNAVGHPLYDFLDPSDSDFVGWVIGLLVTFAVLGYLYWAIGRLRRAVLPETDREVAVRTT